MKLYEIATALKAVFEQLEDPARKAISGFAIFANEPETHRNSSDTRD